MEPTEDLMRGLLSAAPDALLAVNADGHIVYANAQAEHLFGWPREELMGKPVESLVPERFASRHPALRASYAAQPATRPMGAGLELWARRQDGTEFPAEISLSTFHTSDGPLVAAAIRDVTTARRSEQRFRAVLTSAPDAILGVNSDGQIELVNDQAERLFGWRVDELIGKNIEMLVPEERRHVHIAHRGGYMHDPQPRPMGESLQLSAQRKDGSTVPVEISLSTIDDDPGSRLILAAVRDVTTRVELEAARQRQALEAQREQSHRLESLGQLAGGVAHDFNNLLGVILNYSALMSKHLTDPEAVSDLEEIRSAADRAAGLTRQLLTFARRDAISLEPLEVNEVVRSVGSMLNRTLGEDIELQLDLSKEPLVAVTDRHQLEQIVLNLTINARDAMPEGGRITIKTKGSTETHMIELKVVDQGTGMSREVAERAFEPFFTTKPRSQGTGLGLATVYGIARRSGGNVQIDSVLGGGTTVTVTMRQAETSPKDDTAVDHSRPGGLERILLVEDEQALRKATSRILRERGYEVVTANDGIEALDIVTASATSFDLILTDVVMPRMRGDELARKLTDHTATPVVFMSGYDAGDAPLTGRLLAKPVVEEVLLQTVREVLDS